MKTIKATVIMVILFMPFVLYAQTTKPIAVFEFERTTYMKGEIIRTLDTSTCSEDSKIIKREWMINIDGKRKTSASLSSLMKEVKNGTVEVFFRVKDNHNVWSDWTSRKVTITIPRPIKLKSLKSEKTAYAQGEKLQLTYTLENPDELEIKSQRWRYRNLTTQGVTISGKPKYFKKNGRYEISLQIQDEQGNWTDTLKTQIMVTNEKIERDGYYLFKKGKQGDLLEGYIDKDYNTFKQLTDYEVEEVEGKLLVSNSPESILSSGLLYQDTVSGEGRILIHHCNKSGYTKKLLIIAVNHSEEPVTLKIGRRAISGPNKNVLRTGQVSLYQYLTNKNSESYTLPKNTPVCLYSSLNQKSWLEGETISGFLDYEAEGKVTFKIVAVDEKTSMQQALNLNPLTRDGHIRGTFNSLERIYKISITKLDEPAKLVIGKDETEWLEGVDALTGAKTYNKGNYGLINRIQLTTTEDMGVILNARGGKYLGALQWNQNKVFNMPNEDLLNTQKLAALVGMAKANTNQEIIYVLPNGSAAPVLFGFVPEHLWK